MDCLYLWEFKLTSSFGALFFIFIWGGGVNQVGIILSWFLQAIWDILNVHLKKKKAILYPPWFRFH
jgi:hypothetical protein